jgi:CRP/FNR family cyclic AMP-dependent transcriptional regulator
MDPENHARTGAGHNEPVAESPDPRAALRRSYLFEDLPDVDLEPLAAQCALRRMVGGEYVWHYGDRADEIDVVMDGELKDSVVSEEGAEFVHFVHGPGMTFGEPGYFSVERTRIVEVLAVRPTTLLRMHRRVLAPFMDRHTQVKDRALERLASNTRWQTTMISALATRPLVNRLVLRLLELCDSSNEHRDGMAITPRISQSTLASMIGASRENVNRALAVLAERGYVRRESGGYLLLDEEGLRRELARDWPQVERRDRRGDGSPDADASVSIRQV